MYWIQDQPAHHEIPHRNPKDVALLELLEDRQMQQRMMGMPARFAFEALDLARQGFAVLFRCHGVAVALAKSDP